MTRYSTLEHATCTGCSWCTNVTGYTGATGVTNIETTATTGYTGATDTCTTTEIKYPGDPFFPQGSSKVLYDNDCSQYSFRCPHCDNAIVVERTLIACHIFRHGNYITKKDALGRAVGFGEFIPPHAPKHICDELVACGAIVGCGKPLQMYQQDGEYYVRACDYI